MSRGSWLPISLCSPSPVPTGRNPRSSWPVLSGRAPGDPLFQSLAVTAGTSIGGLAAAGGILFTISAGNEIGIAGVIGGLIILGLTYFFFRHGSEIIQGDFSDKKKPLDLKSMTEMGKQIGGLYR